MISLKGADLKGDRFLPLFLMFLRLGEIERHVELVLLLKEVGDGQ